MKTNICPKKNDEDKYKFWLAMAVVCAGFCGIRKKYLKKKKMRT